MEGGCILPSTTSNSSYSRTTLPPLTTSPPPCHTGRLPRTTTTLPGLACLLPAAAAIPSRRASSAMCYHLLRFPSSYHLALCGRAAAAAALYKQTTSSHMALPQRAPWIYNYLTTLNRLPPLQAVLTTSPPAYPTGWFCTPALSLFLLPGCCAD